MPKKIYDTIIIGSGPAGYTAAIYAARGNLKTLVLAGTVPGGQLMITTEVENFPGFEQGITGPKLMEEMREQARRFSAEIIDTDVTAVDFTQKPLVIKTSKETFYAKTSIIATGASAQWLGLDSEKRLQGKGVSGCATCDGFFFKGKDIIVVGGGDSAMEEALFLTKFANSIKIIVRRDKVRASAIMFERAKNHPKISFIYNTQVREFLGHTKIETAILLDTQTKKESQLPIQGAFIAIGHKPNTAIFEDQVELDSLGYVVKKKNTETSRPNVFVAGDVHDKRYRQAVTAAGYGCAAAIDAMRYLEEHEAPA